MKITKDFHEIADENRRIDFLKNLYYFIENKKDECFDVYDLFGATFPKSKFYDLKEAEKYVFFNNEETFNKKRRNLGCSGWEIILSQLLIIGDMYFYDWSRFEGYNNCGKSVYSGNHGYETIVDKKALNYVLDNSYMIEKIATSHGRILLEGGRKKKIEVVESNAI